MDRQPPKKVYCNNRLKKNTSQPAKPIISTSNKQNILTTISNAEMKASQLPKSKVADIGDNEQKRKHLKVSNNQTRGKSSHDVIKSITNNKPETAVHQTENKDYNMAMSTSEAAKQGILGIKHKYKYVKRDNDSSVQNKSKYPKLMEVKSPAESVNSADPSYQHILKFLESASPPPMPDYHNPLKNVWDYGPPRMRAISGQPSPLISTEPDDARLEFLEKCNDARNESFNDLIAIQPKIHLNAQRAKNEALKKIFFYLKKHHAPSPNNSLDLNPTDIDEGIDLQSNNTCSVLSQKPASTPRYINPGVVRNRFRPSSSSTLGERYANNEFLPRSNNPDPSPFALHGVRPNLSFGLMHSNPPSTQESSTHQGFVPSQEMEMRSYHRQDRENSTGPSIPQHFY